MPLPKCSPVSFSRSQQQLKRGEVTEELEEPRTMTKAEICLTASRKWNAACGSLAYNLTRKLFLLFYIYFLFYILPEWAFLGMGMVEGFLYMYDKVLHVEKLKKPFVSNISLVPSHFPFCYMTKQGQQLNGLLHSFCFAGWSLSQCSFRKTFSLHYCY